MSLSILANRDVATPDSLGQTLILAVVLLAIAVVMFRRAGPAFAILATLAGMASYLLDRHIYLACAILLAGLLTRRPPTPLYRGLQEVCGEFGLVGLGFVLYEVGRAATQGSAEAASDNAERLIGLEQSMRLPNEASVQSLFLNHTRVIHLFNFIYSFVFLFIIVAVLFWLFLNKLPVYRLYRTSLGGSALLAVGLSALMPVAPPRLTPRSGLIDTLVQAGGRHGFVNQYAALPSLHVGWSVLAGAMLVRAVGGRLGWLLGVVPGTIVAAAVIVTGNHYWLDGTAGIALCLVAVALTVRPGDRRVPLDRWQAGLALAGIAVAETLRGRRAVRLTCLALASMLAYMLIGEVVAPGFTDHWGYFPPQLTFYIAVAIVGETLFRREGGLFAWQTLFVAIAAIAADVFGTSEDFYATYTFYDKISHFFGTAAFTAVVIDILVVLAARGRIDRPYTHLVVIGVACGIAAGVTWEIYEYVGDHVFHSARTGGRVDTTYDIIFDSFGALTMGLVALNRRWPLAWRQALLERRPAEARGYFDAGSPDSQSS